MQRTSVRSSAPLDFAPLTPERWNDLVALFGANGACGGCWCMWWKRSSAELAQRKGAANRRSFKAIVDRGDVPGFLAYDGDTAVGWCAVEPRERYPKLAASRVLAPIDGRAVWSVTCLFVKAGYRRGGVSLALLRHARQFAAARGARLLEGYPKDLQQAAPTGANSLWTGVATTFSAAGFSEAARRSKTRPIMRCVIRPAGEAS